MSLTGQQQALKHTDQPRNLTGPMPPHKVPGRALLGRCSVPEAVQWSEDNLLAVLEGNRVLIANPADPQGPAAVTPSANPRLHCTHVDGYPSDAPFSAAYMQGFLQARGLQQQSVCAEICAAAWSPTGCSAAGHCLLATVSSLHEASHALGAASYCVAENPKGLPETMNYLRACVSLPTDVYLRHF